jgi:acetyltransferase
MHPYPPVNNEEVILKDGSRVVIRPIRPDDAPRLQQAFKRLSPETIYMRFLEAARELSDQQARYLAEVDYQQRMAFVGTIQEDEEENLVAVARYDMLQDRPGLAEAAIVVRDDFQNRGLGTQIMLHLIRYAFKHGVNAFVATVHTTNRRIMSFIRKSQLPVRKEMLEPGVWEIQVDLSPLKDDSISG